MDLRQTITNITWKFPNSKTSFQFRSEEYTFDAASADILVFKDFLGRHVNKSLYVLDTSAAFGETRHGTTPSTRVLSITEGNRFDTKMNLALKAYQLLNRNMITQYGKKYLGWPDTVHPDSNFTKRQVFDLKNATLGTRGTNAAEWAKTAMAVSGMNPFFAEEYGKIGIATIACMLGWTPGSESLDMDKKEKMSTGYGYYDRKEIETTSYISQMGDQEKSQFQEFIRIKNIWDTHGSMDDTHKTNYLNQNGIKNLISNTQSRNGKFQVIKYKAFNDEVRTVQIKISRYSDLTSGSKVFEERGMSRVGLVASISNYISQLDGLTGGKGGMTAKDALSKMSNPDPTMQREEPFPDPENPNWIHVYVDTGYDMSEESQLLSRLQNSATFEWPPVLKKRSKKEDLVKEVQHALFVDGILGPVTLKSLKVFCKKYDLDFKGDKPYTLEIFRYIDSAGTDPTLAARFGGFDAKYGLNDRDPGGIIPIKILQEFLLVDGKFGTGTANAIKAFQSKHSLTIDGVVGDDTWRILLKEKPESFTEAPKLVKKTYEPLDGSEVPGVEYLQRTLSLKALNRVFEYFRKDKTWKLDPKGADAERLYGKGQLRDLVGSATTDITLSVKDSSLLDFERVGLLPIRYLTPGRIAQGNIPLGDVTFCNLVDQSSNPYEKDSLNSKENWWSATPRFLIPPRRPGDTFYVQYAIDKRKLDYASGAGTTTTVNAIDAGIIAFETAAAIYDKVSKFMEDPHAAFELAEEKIRKSIDDYAAAKAEAISEYKREAVRDAGKNIRNSWYKMRKRTKDRQLKESLSKNKSQVAENVTSRNVNLLSRGFNTPTRSFKKKITDISNKMVDLSVSLEDMKTESRQISTKNSLARKEGGKVEENPYSAYKDLMQMRPPVDLAKDAERFRSIYEVLDGFLKKNGVKFYDNLTSYVGFNFEPVRDTRGVIVGSALSSVTITPPPGATKRIKGALEHDSAGTMGRQLHAVAGTDNLQNLNEPARKLEIGFPRLTKTPPFNNPRVTAYFAQMIRIEEDIVKKKFWPADCGFIEEVPAMEFISKWVWPAPGTAALTEDKTLTDDDNVPKFTVKTNVEQELGMMFSQIKTSRDQLAERLSTMQKDGVDGLVKFEKGKTYDANDLLPLGELCTWEEILEKVLNTIDLKTYWCEFSACLPEIPWPIILNFNFKLPKLPSLPTLKELRVLFDSLYVSLVEMLVRFLCTIVNKLLDLIRLPNCDEVFEAAMFGAASLIKSIREYNSLKPPLPIGDYDISSQFLRTKDENEIKVQKTMLGSLKSFGIPEDLISNSSIDGQSMVGMMDDISALMTPSEITALLRGNPTPDSLRIVEGYIETSLPELSEYIGNPDSISDFFANLGGLIDAEVLNKIDEIPSALAEARFCPETVEARNRIIMGDLSSDQLSAAIAAHQDKTEQQTLALKTMLKSNPLETGYQDLYNPGDPSAMISSIPGPMMDIIQDTSRSIFEVPRFAFITDVSKYTDFLHTSVSRPLQYEDPEFRVEFENKALIAMELLLRNETNLQSVMAGKSVTDKWNLRQKLYLKFHRDVLVVQKKIVTYDYKKNIPRISGASMVMGGSSNTAHALANQAIDAANEAQASRTPGAMFRPGSFGQTGYSQMETTVDLYEEVTEADQERFKKGKKLDDCGDMVDLNENGRTKIHNVVKRKSGYRGISEWPYKQYNRDFVLANHMSDLKSNGTDLVPVTIKNEDDEEVPVYEAPYIRRENGKAIKTVEDLSGIEAAEKATILKEITEDILNRVSNLHNDILRHIEVNMSDKNDSAVLPIIRKYYQREEEAKRESDPDLAEFFSVSPRPGQNGSQFTFEMSLPERFSSKIEYQELKATGRDDPFVVKIHDNILMGSVETFYGCDTLSQESARPPGVRSFGKRHVYRGTMLISAQNLIKFYENNPIYRHFGDMSESLSALFSGEFGSILSQDSYDETFEMFYEEVMTQLSDSRIFTDSKYIDQLKARIRGTKEYDDKGCVISETKGIIDFDKVVSSAVSRVVSAFEDPSFHPSRSEFNAGSMGPFEQGILHACMYLMVNFLIIEFALRGGIAFSAFSAQKLIGLDQENQTSQLFRKYLIKFMKKSLKKLRMLNPGNSRITEMVDYSPRFMDSIIEYVTIADPDAINADAHRDAQETEALNYVIEDIIGSGQLVDMIESIFQGSEQKHESFAKTFLDGLQMFSVPEIATDVVTAWGGSGMDSWRVEGMLQPEQARKKGRFILQNYIRVVGPAASKDLSQYTFSDEFLEFRDQILEEISSIDEDRYRVSERYTDTDGTVRERAQNIIDADPSEVAQRIRERMDTLEELDPLPGTGDDEIVTSAGHQTEVVSFGELSSFLRESYSDSFNEEMCELLGLIYKEDPHDGCFMMPEQFLRFPGRFIKVNYRNVKIDRGFDPNLEFDLRYPLPESLANRFDLEALTGEEIPPYWSSSNHFNNLFAVENYEEGMSEDDIYTPGIFSKCGNKDRPGSPNLVPWHQDRRSDRERSNYPGTMYGRKTYSHPDDESVVTEYYVLPENVCLMSSTLGSEQIGQMLQAYSSPGDSNAKHAAASGANLDALYESYNFDKFYALGENQPVRPGASGSLAAMNASYGHYSTAPNEVDREFQGFRNSVRHTPPARSFIPHGARHPRFAEVKNALSSLEDPNNHGVFFWKMGQVTEEEFEEYLQIYNVVLSDAPLDLEDDTVVHRPSRVYEEWTHYVVQDPGYIFDYPGESFHAPWSMGAFNDPVAVRPTSAVLEDRAAITSETEITIPVPSRYRNWLVRSYNYQLTNFYNNSEVPHEEKGWISKWWGYGHLQMNETTDEDLFGGRDDRYFTGHTKNSQIIRFNWEKSHRTFLSEYAEYQPMMARPLGWQNPNYQHEDTNELGPNQYVCPVDLLVTVVDYKVDEKIMHSETYIGSRFNDGGIMRGEDPQGITRSPGREQLGPQGQVLMRRYWLTEGMARLTQEWIENTKRVIDTKTGPSFVEGELDPYLIQRTQQWYQQFARAFNTGGTGQHPPPGDVIWAILWQGMDSFLAQDPVIMDFKRSYNKITGKEINNCKERARRHRNAGQAAIGNPCSIKDFMGNKYTKYKYFRELHPDGPKMMSSMIGSRARQMGAWITKHKQTVGIEQFQPGLNMSGKIYAMLLKFFADAFTDGWEHLDTSVTGEGAIAPFLRPNEIERVYEHLRQQYYGFVSNPKFGLRPLARTRSWGAVDDIKEPFGKSGHKTNMMTTSKIYSAAAIARAAVMDHNGKYFEPVSTYTGRRPPAPNPHYMSLITEEGPYGNPYGDSMLVDDRFKKVKENVRDMLARSSLVNTVTPSVWRDPEQLFRWPEDMSNSDRMAKIGKICHTYTEFYLNTRTYEGFWGYTSNPRYINGGYSFQELASSVRNLGTGYPTNNDDPTWDHFFRVQDTWPCIVDKDGGQTAGNADYGKYDKEYALERLPYPAGPVTEFAGHMPPAFDQPPSVIVGDGRGENRESQIQSAKSQRGEDDVSQIMNAINENVPATGFRIFLLNKAVHLVFRAELEERRFWNYAGEDLASPQDEGQNLVNYGAEVRNPETAGPEPRGIFERLNRRFGEEMSDRLQNIIRGSNYMVGLRAVHVLSDSTSRKIDRYLNSNHGSANDPIAQMLNLLLYEERIVKVHVKSSEPHSGYNYALPLASSEVSMDRCTLNWRNIEFSANQLIPAIRSDLSRNESFISLVEDSFPIRRFALLAGLYSVMSLSTKPEFGDDFMKPCKESIINVHSLLTSNRPFERVPSGAEMWLLANGHMTSTGPKPPRGEFMSDQLDAFFTKLLENALATPIMLLRTTAGVLDPAYKAMMTKKGTSVSSIKKMTWQSVDYDGLDGKMKNGMTCDGKYVPINVGLPYDLSTNLLPIPNSDFFKALKKFGRFVYRKRRGGTNDSYGDFLGPFGALALSLPELSGETPTAIAALERDGEECSDIPSGQNSGNNTTQEDN